ncbi:MAG: Serine phosphatase RsbU, regulator of sigma subunit, partial [Acidobacteria bacterium]|nr:Serine phosphatase RsbU, regulator of sigma subunit [Acidobacteriota bacterium]
MKIRTQLVLACFLLSIVPLAGLVLYSYQSSRDALEVASANEAARRSRQMDHRLASIRGELEQKLADVSALPLQSLPHGMAGGDRHMVDNVLLALGDSVKLVDSLELQPLAGQPLPPLASTALATATRFVRITATPHAAPHPAPSTRSVETPPVPPAEEAETLAVPKVAETPRAPVAPEAPPEPILIDIPSQPVLPRYGLSDEQRKQIREITRLSNDLSSRAAAMSTEERDALTKQIAAQQSQLATQMDSARQAWEKHFTAAMEARAAEREQRAERQGATMPPATPIPWTKYTRSYPGARTTSTLFPPPSTGTAPAAQAAAQTAPGLPAATAPAANEVVIRRGLTAMEKSRLREGEKQVEMLFGPKLNIPVRHEGAVVANLSAQVKPEEVIRRVLGAPGDDAELVFAADRTGKVYTRTAADRQTLDRLGVSAALRNHKPLPKPEGWTLAMSLDPQSRLRVGVARPVADDLEELRRAAGRNFSAGMALVFIALLGIVPVANHVTRDVKLVTAGAERIAQGDLQTRLPVRSKNEFGQLATAFNKMAYDLSHQQQTIAEQARTRKEQELEKRMLEVEYDRKSIELEDARRFQLSMLPKVVPQDDGFEVAVFIETATEVGGDYYDFHVTPGGALSITVGDATGHGAKAGTMVTVVKTLFASYAAELAPSRFLSDSAEKIKRMDLGRMAMSLVLARFEPDRLTLASAGMPPVLVHRAATGEVEELSMAGTPLGTLGSDYADRTIALATGDTVLLLTDGLPELLGAAGEQFGYPATLEAFATAAKSADAASVIAALAATAKKWSGDEPP